MTKRLYRMVGLFLCSLILSGALCDASAPKEINIYISAEASEGGDGTHEHPFCTIEEAKEYVRTINQNMECDINVNIGGGVYRLNDTLCFDEKDSGSNGYYINYRGMPDETVKILGSKQVTAWKQEADFFTAPFDADYVRTIFVNNQRIGRAGNETPYVVEEMYQDNDETYQYDGIVVNNKEFLNYTNKSDIQLHFGLSWISSLNNVEDIIAMPDEPEKSIILMKQPEFDKRAKHGLPVKKDIKFFMENSFEELDKGGEFYFNRAEKKLYYLPRENEKIENMKAEVPVLEELIKLNGSSSLRRVKNLSFSGLEFAYCAYERPAKYGLELIQANQIYGRNEADKLEITPAAISFNWAEKIRFSDNVVRGMESVGIGLYQGVRLSKFNGNLFEDISDSAITVGFPSQSADSPSSEWKNLAASKPTTASGFDENFEPGAAVDDTGAGWSGKGNPMWWQVDLEAPYRISKVEIDPRQLDQPNTRVNFQILGSNDPNFKEFSVLASQGSTPFDIKKTAEFYVDDEGTYRYLRIQKTDGGYLYLQEVRVFDEETPFEAARETCKNNVISNNYLNAISIENWSAPAICAYYVNNLSILHNEITNTAYSGISIGWGWASKPGSKVCRDNVVSYNYIHNHALRCFDAGGIYTLGQQPNSVEEGNYIADQGNHLAGLYSDNGTKHYTIKNNVTENTGYSTFINSGSGDLVHKNNYTSDLFRYSPSDSLYEEPKYFIPGNPSLEALTIMKKAGLEEEYRDIKKKSVSSYKVTEEQKLSNAAGIASSVVPTLSENSYAQQYILFMLDAAEKYLVLAETGDGICQYPKDALTDYRTAIEKARSDLKIADLTADRVSEIKIEFDAAYEKFKNSSNLMEDDELLLYAQSLLSSAKVGNGLGNISEKASTKMKSVIEEYQKKSKPFEKIDKQWLQRYCEKFRNDAINLDIKGFTLDGQLAPTVIDEEKGEITVIVKYGSDRRALAPQISYHENVIISPANNLRVNFNNPVSYRLKTKDGKSEKTYLVKVKYPDKIDGYYNMKPAIEDKNSWNITGTIENSYYKSLIFGDSDLEFDMHAEDIKGQWAGIAFRNQNFNKSFEEKNNDCYVIVFTESAVELHRFNNGIRTQFYGDVDGVEKICGASLKSDAFKFGEKNRIRLSTVNRDGGVLIDLSVNGKEIFSVFDNYEGVITEPGYFGTVTSRPLITLSAE